MKYTNFNEMAICRRNEGMIMLETSPFSDPFEHDGFDHCLEVSNVPSSFL